jgi:hypothetical protein
MFKFLEFQKKLSHVNEVWCDDMQNKIVTYDTRNQRLKS